MKLQITRVLGLFLLVPAVGAFIISILFYFNLARINHNVHFTNLAGRQRMLSEQLGHYAHMVYEQNQDVDREPLKEFTAAFDRSLKALEQGGEIDGLKLQPAPPEMIGSLDNVKQLWQDLKPSLLVVANQPKDDPQSGIAYDFVRSNIPGLTYRSDEIVSRFSEWDKQQRYRIFYILATLVGISSLSLIGGIWVTKRYVAERKQAEETLRESEERYRGLIQGVDAIVWEADADTWQFTFVSQRAEEILGYTTEQWLSEPDFWVTHIHPDDREKSVSYCKMCISEGKGHDFEYRAKAADGHYVWFRDIVRVIKDFEGKPAQLRGIMVDITERKQAEIDIHESEAKFRGVVEQSNDGVYVLQGNRFVFINPMFTEIMGYELKEISSAGFDFRQLVTEEGKKVLDERGAMRERGEEPPSHYIFKGLRKDGREIDLGVSVTTIEWEGTPARLGTLRDITERKQAEEALKESKAYIENIYTSIADILLVINPDAIIQSVNAAAPVILGYSEDELVGMSVDKLFANGKGQKNVFEKRILSIVEGRLQAICDHEPEDFWSLLKTGPLGVVVVDSKGRMVMVNKAAESIFGYSEDELSGQAIHMLLPPDLQKIHEKHRTSYMDSPSSRHLGKERILKAKKKDGTTIKLEVGLIPLKINGDTQVVSVFRDPADKERWELIKLTRFGKLFEEEKVFMDVDRRLITKDGNKIPVLMSGSVMRDEDGKIQAAVLVAKDITQQVKAQEQREEALKQAEGANRVKTLFLANMSHEIRTPLNAILGFTDIIESCTREFLNSEEQSFFDTIRDSGNRLMRTIHGILDISQIESGTLDLNLKKLDLGKLTEKVVNECQPMAQEKGLVLSFNSSTQDAIIIADKYSISQSLSNLIDNAIKYTEKGKVEVKLGGKGKKLTLTIQDTGIGISEDYLESIYETFTQESTGYTRSFEGVGLGMALTKRHLDMNNVKISVKSTKGKGTTFTLTFESAGKQLPAQEVKEPETTIADAGKEPVTKPLVLVVEDDPGSRNLVKFFLKDSHEVFFAGSVAEAKEQLKKHRMELILLDLSLHGNEDGLDLARYLRQTKKWKDLSIIALTAHAFVTDRENSLAAGCDDFLVKPINKERLLEKIKLYL